MEPLNPYDKHIPPHVYENATKFAFEDVRTYTDKLPLPWKRLSEPKQLKCPGPDYRSVDANLFGQVIADISASFQVSLPDGYASWLMVDRKNRIPIGIAIKHDQLIAWCAVPTKPTVFVDAQAARCILHEIGHFRVTPHLMERRLSSNDGNRVGSLQVEADPEDEVGPWMYATCILGVLLAQHSLYARRDRDTDDTPSIQI